MSLTKDQKMLLVVDTAMDKMAVILAEAFTETPDYYASLRTKAVVDLLDACDPLMTLSAEMAVDYMDKKVSDVIRENHEMPAMP